MIMRKPWKVKHNLSRVNGNGPMTPEYQTWYGINSRCNNPKDYSYGNYGGRGIKVCHEWHRDNPDGLVNFIKDMWPRPEGMSLDRIDNNGDYSTENCRWATSTQQTANRDMARNLPDEVIIREYNRRFSKC